jgi:hypothetical protein
LIIAITFIEYRVSVVIGSLIASSFNEVEIPGRHHVPVTANVFWLE